MSVIWDRLIDCKDEIIEIADLVTSMELIKHPFRSGVKAQIGIEF